MTSCARSNFCALIAIYGFLFHESAPMGTSAGRQAPLVLPFSEESIFSFLSLLLLCQRLIPDSTIKHFLL